MAAIILLPAQASSIGRVLAVFGHGLFLKRANLFYRQDAEVAKANKIDVSVCGKTMSGKLGGRNGAHVEFQAKTMIFRQQTCYWH